MRSALFACIVAAAFGCNDRSTRDATFTSGAGAGAEAIPTEQRVDRAGTVNESTGAAVRGAEARRTERPTRRTVTPAAPPPTPTNGFGMGMGTPYSGAER